MNKTSKEPEVKIVQIVRDGEQPQRFRCHNYTLWNGALCLMLNDDMRIIPLSSFREAYLEKR